MNKILKTALKILLRLLILLCIFLLCVFIYHTIRSQKEKALLEPIGQLTEVGGSFMNVYTEGTEDTTIVFMSGGGTCSPVLDFRSLYTLLTDDYKIAVVEKFGYGFSDVTDKQRDIDTMLEDTRAALTAAGLSAPYVLCPHSMSGLEALYWAQKYPEEVSAIIGLDMAVPQYYEYMEIDLPLMRLSGLAARIGITRLIPDLAESDAIKYGTLSDHEKDIYRAVFYSRTATQAMINEAAYVRENAKTVENLGIPQVPMLLFISDGSGGTGFDKEAWRSIPEEYIAQVKEGEYTELDCPHYVHDHEYELIAEKTVDFLTEKKHNK